MRWEYFNNIVYQMVKLAYLNILWIVFTIIGLGIFGLFPATAAMFAIIRKMQRDEQDGKIFTSFWYFYRKDFVKLNGFGLIFLLIGYFLYYDFFFLQQNSGKLQFLFPILIFIFLSTGITLIFFFPVFVHFDLKFWQYFKQSFLIAISSPIELVFIIISGGVIYFVATLLPGIIPLFTGSIFAYLTTWLAFKSFARVNKKLNSST